MSPEQKAHDQWPDKAVLAALIEVLQHDALRLHYQPQVRLADSAVVGVEALLRWTHPQYGAVSPACFIPVAEAGGLIEALGEWVLRRACRDVPRLQDAFGSALRVAVNVSPLQLQRADLAQLVASALADAHISPRALELELTESAPLPVGDAVHANLAAIRATGVSLALDDFGVGHANLRYLLEVGLDTLKIDGLFVRASADNRRAAVLLRAALALAAQLDLAVVAECVETTAQLKRLREVEAEVLPGGRGCSVQGFYFSPPLDCASLCSNAEAVQRQCRQRAAAGAQAA